MLNIEEAKYKALWLKPNQSKVLKFLWTKGLVVATKALENGLSHEYIIVLETEG